MFGQPSLTCCTFQLKLQPNLEHWRYIPGPHMNSSEDHCFTSQGERQRSIEQNTYDSTCRQQCIPHSAINGSNHFFSFWEFPVAPHSGTIKSSCNQRLLFHLWCKPNTYGTGVYWWTSQDVHPFMPTILKHPCTPGNYEILKSFYMHSDIWQISCKAFTTRNVCVLCLVSSCGIFTFMVSGWQNIHTVELCLLLLLSTGDKDVDRKELEFNVYWTAWQWSAFITYINS
jgi:hypothetical protein